jgi:hypothetical protein
MRSGVEETDMTQASNVINLAEVRAARQAAAAAASPAPPAPVWRQSQRGNPWTKDERSGLHLVLYETRCGWSGRVTPLDGEGWYLNMPPDVGSAEEARAWAEGWLAEAAHYLASTHAG